MGIVLYVLNELFLIRKRYYFTIEIMRVRLLRQIESGRENFLGDTRFDLIERRKT